MAKHGQKQTLEAIEGAVAAHPEGVGIQDIEESLEESVTRRTLQYRLKQLVDEGHLVKEGERRWVKYRLPERTGSSRGAMPTASGEELPVELPLSASAVTIRDYVRKPIQFRQPVGYNRAFLDAYRPNETAYLSEQERAHLLDVGTSQYGEQPAGTYARQILNRLLIDLSWNSSRLEGNTYSLLDTRRLIDFGEEAEGRGKRDTQMILNHKDAIEFLVEGAEEIGFNRYTILNLHALLANNLLADRQATGRPRRIAVGIEGSVFHPLEGPQRIEECFEHLLSTAGTIENPFEQAFFAMVHLPYLQPFEDANKRVSRLAANIPLIQRNLTPLSFADVPARTYTEAILGVYELNRVDLLKEIFIWAYERSAHRYAAVQQSLGEPDSFRLRHRAALRNLVQTIILERLDRKAAFARITVWTGKNIASDEQEKFRQVTESEVTGLHEGNFARYQIRPSEFNAWQEVWNKPGKRGIAGMEDS